MTDSGLETWGDVIEATAPLYERLKASEPPKEQKQMSPYTPARNALFDVVMAMRAVPKETLREIPGISPGDAALFRFKRAVVGDQTAFRDAQRRVRETIGKMVKKRIAAPQAITELPLQPELATAIQGHLERAREFIERLESEA